MYGFLLLELVVYVANCPFEVINSPAFGLLVTLDCFPYSPQADKKLGDCFFFVEVV